MKYCALLLFIFFTQASIAQVKKDTTIKEELIEKLTYKQQPGLAMAASKIFFSEKRYSVSGFGEVNWVNYRGPKDTEVGDLELYYTGLYRFASFFGYRFSPKVIWNSEFQIEYLHDGINEGHTEIVIEAFLDYLWKDYLKARVGFYPLPIGYVNNNDEPVMFYSVNRSEVERIITPSTWIEFGAMFYGNISPSLSYAFGISQGLKSENFLSGTWIRQGREIRLSVPQSVSINPQIIYSGIDNLTLSASGYFGNTAHEDASQPIPEIKAPVRLGTGYAKYEWDNFRFVSVGTMGNLGDTDLLFQRSFREGAQEQVLGESVYGYLFEFGADILPYLRKGKTIKDNTNWFSDNHEMKLPLFVRFERLDTHSAIHPSLLNANRVQNNLRIWTLGVNFNTRENIVFKANYQFRKNLYKGALVQNESNILEFGFGFIF
jgi:hypothetical protein